MISSPIFERRNLRFGRLDHEWAARMKPAPDRGIHWRRRLARQENALPCAFARWIDNRHRTDERFRVRMRRFLQDPAGLAELEKRSRHVASVFQVPVWATRSLR